MNHGFKLHPDGTLEITMPKGVKVGRVLVREEGAQDGALYCSKDVPDTNSGDTISRRGFLRAFEEMCSCTDYGWDERDFRDLIIKMPSAEPEKEIPRRVLWSGWKGTRYTRYKCPNCNKPVKNDDVYCHRCGQKLMFPHISHTPYIEGQKQELIVRWDDEE